MTDTEPEASGDCERLVIAALSGHGLAGTNL
jgi:hypothetical protein